MREQLLSVGIDIGTTTTQMVLSKLTLCNRANSFSVPRVEIAEKEVVYRSEIHFTPLLDERTIDARGVREIVAQEYRAAGCGRDRVDTGAIIITGETARKENAKAVLEGLSEFAGDFVVAAAGADLESVLAARGAGADEYSRKNRAKVLHFDIGGGTSNLALYEQGELAAVGCFDVGGRLIKVDGECRVSYISPKLQKAIPRLRVGARCGGEEVQEAVIMLVRALEQAAGLGEGTQEMDYFRTHGTEWTPPDGVTHLSFSGGVADCIFSPPNDPFRFGDIGGLLGKEIARSPCLSRVEKVKGAETIRATVIGAGSHATDISGSTIFYRGVKFPMKNLPVLKLTEAEEEGDEQTIAEAIEKKLRWFADEDGINQVALGLRGWSSPSYQQVMMLARGVAKGLAAMMKQRHFPIIVVEQDMAKVLGQALAGLIPGGLLCLDGISVTSGDYIDIGAPAADGTVLPVVMKTLLFNKEASI